MNQTLRNSRASAAKAAAGISSHPIYKTVLRRIKDLGSSGIALDFGAGTGVLTAMLRDTSLFSKIHAIDLIDYGREDEGIVEWLLADLNYPLALDSESYDLIAAVEIIEHLENPRLLAREWFRLLRAGGHLIVSTPNNESWRSIASLLMRGHFAAFTGGSYPAHITALLRLDLHRVLMEAGFVDIGIDFTNSGGIPSKPTLTWQQLSLGLLGGVRFSDNIVCSARKPVNAPS